MIDTKTPKCSDFEVDFFHQGSVHCLFWYALLVLSHLICPLLSVADVTPQWQRGLYEPQRLE